MRWTVPGGAYTQLEALLQLRFAARDLSLSARRYSQSQQAGQSRTRFRGRGMEFEEVRLYQPGDDIRSIDWRVTARTQVPHTKLYREERERPVLVVTDQRSGMFFGSRTCFKSVTACHVSALLGWAALHHNDRIGGLLFNDSDEQDIRPRRSRHTLLALLQGLHDFNHRLQSPVAAPAAVALEQRLLDLRRITKPGSALFIVSDFHDLGDACREPLYRLSRHNEVTLIQISDPLETELPAQQLLQLSNGQQRIRLDSGDPRVATEYCQRYQQRLTTLTTLCQQLGLPLLQISTVDAPAERLHQLTRGRP
jgi:uncharacterized protein (DUF58 family)